MEILSDKKTFDINKFNKNVLEEYINTYSRINDNNNFERKNKEEKLLIYVITFNMNGGMPSDKEIALLFPKKEKIEHFDIFVINSQECLRSIGASFFINSKEIWVDALTKFLGDKYEIIINSTLGAIHMAIFIKKEKAIPFSDIRKGEIKTGFLNIIGNKGAISASMKYYDKHILFICCHLTAGHDKRNVRNDELKRIGTSLQNIVDKNSRNKLKNIRKSLIIENNKINNLKGMKTLHAISNKSDSVTKNESKKKRSNRNSMNNIELKMIFKNEIEDEFNDKDYEEDNNNKNWNDDEKDEKERLNSTNKNNKEKENNESKNDNNNDFNKIYNDINKSFTSSINENDKKDKLMEDYDFVIMSGDFNYRLNINDKELDDIMKKNDPEILWDKDQFTEEIKNKQNFKEGVINFMPTYKFKRNSNEYDNNRIPGWTDRIIYKSKRYYDIMLCEYSSINNITFSDHKPVYAVFKIDFKDKKFISKNFHKNEQECCIY